MKTEAPIEKLKKRYADKGIALVLGAGISLGCGLPNWTELLARVGEKIDPSGGRGLVLRLKALGYSLPMIAGVLESRAGAREFDECLREALYTNFVLYGKVRSQKNLSRLRAIVASGNPTLAAVAAFCAVKRDGQVRPNPLLGGVANTNFDALLTNYVTARYGVSLLRTIERASASRSGSRIAGYHLHGFLQFWKGEAGRVSSEAPDARVLTEQDFFGRYNAQTSVFTYTMLFLLREYSVLFVGASLQDDNMRRLLHYSRQERYLSYRDEKRSPKDSERKARRHWALMERPSADVQSAIEQSLERLGVVPVWVSDLKEIPTQLGAIYGASGDKWEDVYP